MAICAKFNLYMASMCIEFLNVSIQPVCRYTQCQNLMFRYSAESGYRICRILNIAYNGKRPEDALEDSCFYCKQLPPSGINVCQLERPGRRADPPHPC